MDIGKAIKNIRESAGISRPELAKEIGVTPGALWKIEAGKTRAKDATIAKICDRFSVPLARLICMSFTAEDFTVR